MPKLTKQQTDKKEKIVKAMKRNKGDFEKQYGDDAKSVMYATATKLAQKESVEFAVKFDESIPAYEFADKLRGYNISKNDSFSTEIDGSTTIMFESKIDNDDFINWLCEKHEGVGVTLTYEEFLPIPSNQITGENAMTFDKFARTARSVDYDVFFAEERLEEAEDAYKKTRAYKKMSGDKKEAVDYFMQQVEKHGLDKIAKVTKDTTVRYQVSAQELNKFLEDVFFTEDVDYIYSFSEADEDPMKKKVEKDREDTKKEQEKDEEQKDKDEEKKEAEDKKEDEKQQADTEKEKDAEDKEGEKQDTDSGSKTFANFKSSLKPGEKGKPSIAQAKEKEKNIELEKPAKGSPIQDAEMKDDE
jgi:hypothetical protein